MVDLTTQKLFHGLYDSPTVHESAVDIFIERISNPQLASTIRQIPTFIGILFYLLIALSDT
jgi:hypothetical protein